MGISIRNCYKWITGYEHLHWSAHRTLLHGRRYGVPGSNWKMGQEYCLHRLSIALRERTYRHGRYEVFKVYDPKERVILAAGLTDRVVHHALHDAIEPIIDRKFIAHSYACRRAKGQHRAIQAAQGMLRKNAYFMHLDVKKYFYSIDRQKLLSIVSRSIDDEGVSWLLTHIIESSDKHAYANRYREPAVQLSLFETEGEVAGSRIPMVTDHRRGLPIGNLTSQLLANWYLNELDQFVLHTLKRPQYIRYMDDMVFFSRDKRDLLAVEEAVNYFCTQRLGLTLHRPEGVSRYSSGLPFLGFRIFRDHLRLKREAVQRFRKKLQQYMGLIPYRTQSGFGALHSKLQSWNHHASFGDTLGLRTALLNQYPVSGYMLANNFNLKAMNQAIRWT